MPTRVSKAFDTHFLSRRDMSFRDGTPPLEGLAVDAADLERAIERLGGAGVSFSHAMFDSVPRFPRAAYMLG